MQDLIDKGYEFDLGIIKQKGKYFCNPQYRQFMETGLGNTIEDAILDCIKKNKLERHE